MPYDPSEEPNGYEVLGRYVAQVLTMERFLDFILLIEQVKPRDLKRMYLAPKIEKVTALIRQPDQGLSAWDELPDKMTQVRQNRNLFAHRMFDRTVPLPAHFGGELGEPLTMEELREQESEAVEVTYLVQSLYERMHYGADEPQLFPPRRGVNDL